MNALKVDIVLFLIISSFSCTKVINENLNSSAPQLVITGEVTDKPGPYHISITKTSDFSDSNNFPRVSGANVILNDNSGLRDSLTETAPGIYSTSIGWQGIPGNSYTLLVTVAGINYRASSKMPEPVPLDSVGFEHHTSEKESMIKAIPYFKDPAATSNYYQFREIINGRQVDNIFVFDDQYSDGKYIHEPILDDSLSVGENLVFKMYCIDQNTYQYLSELHAISTSGVFQPASPANPTSNFTNGALGYFSAHTVDSIHCIVHL